MKPKDRKERYARQGGNALSVADVNDQPIDLTTAYTENSTEKPEESVSPVNIEEEKPIKKKVKVYTDEEIKIMAIKQAISMAKLFSDITTENIIELATIAASFIKYRKLAG